MPDETLEFYDPIPTPHEEAPVDDPPPVDPPEPELTDEEKAEEAEAQAILAEEEAKHKGKSGSAKLKDRLERERAEKAEALARAERAEAALAAQQKPPSAPVVPPVAAIPSLDQFLAQYPNATYDQYEGFKIAFVVEEAKRQMSIQNHMERAKSKWDERAAKIPDFNTAQAVQAVKAAAGTAYSPVVWDSIEESEQGPEILDHLRKNPEEARRIAGLNERQAVKELGRLEERLASKAQPPTPTKTTQAPPPVRPVAGRSASPSPVSEDKEMY